jgi:alkylmercury lyase
VEPNDVMVSFKGPETVDFMSATRVIATGCRFVFFFASPASGERWVAKHPGMVLLPLEEAFALGKRINARVFGRGLERRREEAA